MILPDIYKDSQKLPDGESTEKCAILSLYTIYKCIYIYGQMAETGV